MSPKKCYSSFQNPDPQCLKMLDLVGPGYYCTYLPYCSGALLVYDVSSRESFNSLANWLTDARTLASPAIVILLVGNKKDLEDEREVTFLEASRYRQ